LPHKTDFAAVKNIGKPAGEAAKKVPD